MSAANQRPSDWLSAIVPVLRRPDLWSTAVVVAARMAPSGWWRRRPFLPLPDPAYLEFRLQTAHGAELDTPADGDLVTYLAWVRDWNTLQRQRPSH